MLLVEVSLTDRHCLGRAWLGSQSLWGHRVNYCKVPGDDDDDDNVDGDGDDNDKPFEDIRYTIVRYLGILGADGQVMVAGRDNDNEKQKGEYFVSGPGGGSYIANLGIAFQKAILR